MKPDTLVAKIGRLLHEVEQITDQGAVYQGLYEQCLLSNHQVCAFCQYALHHPVSASLCRVACRNAPVHATASGEPYFYRCWANLLFVTIPVAPQNKCCGGVELGGFCIAGEEADLRETTKEIISTWPNTDPAPFFDTLPSVRHITTSDLRGLGSLVMETSFYNGINSSEFFRKQNEKYVRQRRIAEALADIRLKDPAPPDVLGDTYHLVSLLTQNDKTGAAAFVSHYLAKLLMASHWDLVKFKAHLRLLLAMLTRQTILNGIPWAVATSRELRLMLRLEHAASTEECCDEATEWIHHYFGGQESSTSDGRTLAERVTSWLQSHYQESITLTTASRSIGASASTLVHRLRKETGKTFKQLLIEIRIAEAKKLLATTSLELSEIGDTCGFFDQSHFTREFKRSINLTPGQFRKLLCVPDDALRRPGTKDLDETAPLRVVKKKKISRSY